MEGKAEIPVALPKKTRRDHGGDWVGGILFGWFVVWVLIWFFFLSLKTHFLSIFNITIVLSLCSQSFIC